MTRSTAPTRLENRIFATPIARAFVARVMARHGLTEAGARKIYIGYLRKTDATAAKRPRAAA